MTRGGSAIKQNTADDPLEGVDWNCDWDTEAAAHLFAAVRELCGVPPAVPEFSTNVTTALQEVRETLGRAGENAADPIVIDAGDGDGGDYVGVDAADDDGWARAAVEYHEQRAGRRAIVELNADDHIRRRRLLADEVSFPRAYGEITTGHTSGRAADFTVEALMIGLRRGERALDEPETRRRLAELSDEQAVEVGSRLRKLKPEIASPWRIDEVSILVQMRERLK
jgi:hypothetical protein